MKRVVALVAAAAVVSTVAGFAGAQASPGAATADPPFTPTLAAWNICGSYSCSKLTVPLDYAHPENGKRVKIAVKRRGANPLAGAYQGIVLVNPGGPGGSGTDLADLQGAVPNGGGDTYDWIGFDPRGVAASTPALRCDPHFFGNDRPSFVPTTAAIKSYWLIKTKRYALACGKASGKAVLPFLTTRDVVKDMESFRVAYQAQADFLKKPKLDVMNYYGFSYGTYLGQVYATLYPTKVGRFVLDGVVDPTTWWYQGNLDQETDFDRNINIYFMWLAAHSSTFHLGTSWLNIRTGYYKLLKRLDKSPASHGRLGPDEVTDAMLDAGYFIYDWVAIGKAYSDLVRNNHGDAMFKMYSDGSQGDDNGYAVYLGVQCTDVKRPSWTTQEQDAKRLHPDHPFLTWDNTWYNVPCLNWPAPAKLRIPVSDRGVTGTMLLISETLDAATSYTGALTLRGLFPTARLIAGVGGTTHASSLSGVDCVDNKIAAFFADGTLPARKAGRHADVLCPKLAPPSVNGRVVNGRVVNGRVVNGRVATQHFSDRMSPASRASVIAGGLPH